MTFDEGATFRVTSVNTWPGVPGLVLMLTADSSAQDAALADRDFILEADETVLVVGTTEFSFDDATLSHSDTTGDNAEYTGVVLATWTEGEPADRGMYFILRLTQLIVRPDSRLGVLRYKIAPKCLLSGPFGHSGVGGNPGVAGTVRSYNLVYTYPCQGGAGGLRPARRWPSA